MGSVWPQRREVLSMFGCKLVQKLLKAASNSGQTYHYSTPTPKNRGSNRAGVLQPRGSQY